ncbi:MAG: glycosyltransferase family 4 protein [Rhodospirillales bacterium]|nr:glycosyltransferase family 4 protein [Rhodospirillales bacterium]
MIESAIILSIALPFWALARDIRIKPAHQLALSPFWYFTFLFIIAFPVRAYFVSQQLINLQTIPIDRGYHFDEMVLSLAVLFSALLWTSAMWGREQATVAPIDIENLKPRNPTASPSFTRISTGLSLIICVTTIGLFILGRKTLGDFDGAFYQASRMGNGPLWLLPEFTLYGTLALIGWIIVHSDKPLNPPIYLLLAIMVGITFWASGMLFTRRLMAGAALALIVLLVTRDKRMWPFSILAIIATVFAAGGLELVRNIFLFISEGHTSQEILSLSIQIFDGPFLLIHSSFEGIEHLVRLFERANWIELLIGVDQGLSWLFNFGFGLIPRVIWVNKPVIYGGMEQFHWLYPEIFKGNFADATIPMSFAVDFSFGFGLPFALVIAYAFGRLLGAAERTFWDEASHPAQVALSLFIFIYMFNWVRGGTIIVQSVMLFSIPAALMFGLRPVLHAAFGLAGETVGLVGGKWWGTSRVYFYPHAYLRDRQLDTVRNWPASEAVNTNISTRRSGAQVSRDQALTPSRSSWKSILPLINLKRRPKDAPKNAVIYVWGGLITKGPFIIDIDNPYAFTGYNTLAVRLYRPIIQAFLESTRCLQIRCLSQACLDGVYREYGELAASKAVVTYPKITVKVTEPRTQSADICRFLFVSTQFEIKGGAALLRAFKRVVAEFPGAELDLVTHLSEGVDANIANVRLHPASLTREEISERFLSTADVLVHPTYFDSFGMVVLEALAHGLPVIATDVYALKEMVEDQINGLLLEAPLSIWSGTEPSPLFSDTTKVRDLARIADTSKFEDALTEAMLKMARDPEFRTRASAASLNLVRTKFAGTS